MKLFRKKPVVIEAVQLTSENWSNVCDFLGEEFFQSGGSGAKEDEAISLNIPTLEGVMTASENDWIIRGVQGEIYPCKPDIFDTTYEPVED